VLPELAHGKTTAISYTHFVKTIQKHSFLSPKVRHDTITARREKKWGLQAQMPRMMRVQANGGTHDKSTKTRLKSKICAKIIQVEYFGPQKA
jgi:hypothetical protein